MHIVHTESSCGWGGQELRILTEAQGLQARGHKISLICPEQSNIYKVAPEFDLTPIALPIERKNFKGLFAIRSWLKKHQSDISVINTHSSTDSWLTAIACQTISKELPIVRTRHVSSPINTKRSTFWLYQKAAKHIAVTGEPLRYQLAEQNGFDLNSITSVPTGIDLKRFFPATDDHQRILTRKEGFNLGILATLRSWKGHSYLFEAMQDVIKACPDLHLFVIGDGPQRQNLEDLSTRLGLDKHITFTGNQEVPEDWLRELDLFILPSYGDEGVSQAVMQAMATKLPVITTPVGGMRDAVQHDETGILIDIKNANSIKNSIIELYNNTNHRSALALSGYDRAQTRFGRKVMLDKMEEIFSRASNI